MKADSNAQPNCLKLTLAVPEVRVADVAFNTRETISVLHAQPARTANPHLVVFPELGLTGKSCGDLFWLPSLKTAVQAALEEVEDECKKSGLWALIGLPLEDYNTAALLSPQGLRLVISAEITLDPFTRAPSRYFLPWSRGGPGSIKILDREVPFCSASPLMIPELYDRPFAVVVGKSGNLDLMRDVSLLVSMHSQRALAHSNTLPDWRDLGGNTHEDLMIACVGGSPCDSSAEGVYSGEAAFYSNFGNIKSTPLFSFETQTVSLELPFGEAFPWSLSHLSSAEPIRAYPFINLSDPEAQFKQALEIQSAALQQRLRHTRQTRVVLGLSGGADSSLALLVCWHAFERMGLDKRGILAIYMPGPASSVHSQQRAQVLCKAAGITLRTISITDSVHQHLKDIGHPLDVYDITYENAQARERTQILMDLSNQENALVVGTGDLSEIALGWSTYNGDHISMYNVNAGIPKTLLLRVLSWAGAYYLGETGKQASQAVAEATISPELVPAEGATGGIQSTESHLGPYLLHDFFLWHLICLRKTPAQVFDVALQVFEKDFSPDTIQYWLRGFVRRFFASQFKRSASADGPQVVEISLSPRDGWMMPSDASSELWLAEIDTLMVSKD